MAKFLGRNRGQSVKITIAYQCGEPVADILNALSPFFKADPHTASEVAEG